MQIRYKILKVKDVFEKDLKEVTCDLRTWVLKVLKAIKKYFKN